MVWSMMSRVQPAQHPWVMVKFVLPLAFAILRVSWMSWLRSAAVREQFSPLEPPMTTVVRGSAGVD
jgi:hypothetical protein